jgi:DNA topoisomerase IB
MRLRRSNLDRPGYRRRRAGKGFSYLRPDGSVLRDATERARIEALVIPPAWTDVWICTDGRGHIQATGTDAAGRTQYLYHPDWRTGRDRAKFARTRAIARHLPRLRDRIRHDLTHGRGLNRARVLATIVHLLDTGMFRIGSAQYADRDEDPSFGLSTLRPDHVSGRAGCIDLRFPGKSGVEHTGCIEDGDVCMVLRDLRRRRRNEDRLFAYWDPGARRWREVDAADINGYLREVSGREMTAKDFRTWHGTVAAAQALAEHGPEETRTGRRRAEAKAMRSVADALGNTPAVARSSYVDPKVVAAYEKGRTIDPQDPDPEQEVLDLLGRT